MYYPPISKAESKRRTARAAHAREFINPEKRSAAVRETGLVNASSGLLDEIRTSETCREGGLKGGHTNVISGHAAMLPHYRWHVNRGRINPDCQFCIGG